MRQIILSVVFGFFFSISFGVAAQENQTYTLVIKDHIFSPKELKIPAHQKIKLIVDNQDPTAEEFESYALNREKVVAGGKKIIVFIGPLKPGSYEYIGEFHKDTAKGVIVAQ